MQRSRTQGGLDRGGERAVPWPRTGRAGRALVLVAILLVSLVVAVSPTQAAEDPTITIQHDGEELALEPAPNQTIRGTSTLSNGTEVAVRIRSSGANPFIKTKLITVGPNGSFAVSFDLSEIEPTAIRVSVRARNGSVTDAVDGRIGSPKTTTAQTLDLPAKTHVQYGEVATIPLSLPAGDTAVLTITGRSTDYRVVVRVADANEDATVRLTFATEAAGTGSPTIGVEGGDRFEVLEPEPAGNNSQYHGSFDLALGTDAESDPVAIGSLVVDGDATTRTTHRDPAQGGATLVPPLSDPFWRTTAPGVAGVLALLSGLTSLVVSRR